MNEKNDKKISTNNLNNLKDASNRSNSKGAVSDMKYKNISSKGISNLTLEGGKDKEDNDHLYIKKEDIVSSKNKEIISNNEKFNNEFHKQVKDEIEATLKKLKSYFPQFDMNGDKNIWIMKPSGLSRGRGIACISNLNELLQFIKRNSSQYIIQKYIENP